MTRHTANRPVLTYAAAAALVDKALAHAGARGWNVAAAVLDPGGAVIAAGRMDGVPPAILDFAMDKGFTATLGRSSKAFGQRMSSDPEMMLGASNRARTLAWEGGVPILEDGVIVGAMGVSGATGPEDAECATTAIAALGLATA